MTWVIISIIIIIILLIAICLFAIKPNEKRPVGIFYGKEYAHRGLHGGDIPENSMAAFHRAVAEGYGVELDVQMTKDERLVVFHDANLKRMCGVEGKLKDFTFDELQEFTLKGSDQTIPLFKDVLECLGNTLLVCEIKPDNGAMNYDFVEKVYNELCEYKGTYCMESFSPFITGWFKKYHPEIIRGQLSCRMAKEESGQSGIACFLLTNLMLNFISRPDFISYDFKATDTIGYRLVKKIFNPFRIAWTPRGPEEITEAKKEFDTIIFELEARKI